MMVTSSITVVVKKESDKAPVFCKMDGQRFSQQKTIKLAADCNYIVELHVRPARTVQ